MEQDILNATKIYLEYTSDLNDVPSDEFLLLLIERIIGEYKEQRCYPADMDVEDINADMEKYFTLKSGYIATEVIPAILGKVGSEGLYSLVDNQVSKNWKYPFPVYLPDVIPYCEVI